MKLYKLTDENGRTHGGTQWGEGVSHRATGAKNQDLCSDGWIHAYKHPLLAVLLNPIHANFQNPQLWEAEGKIEKRDGQLKAGVRRLTTVRRIPLPEVSIEQRIRFGILCVVSVYKEPSFLRWADNWLTGKDRTAAAAWAAEASAAASAAAWAAEAKCKIDLIAIAKKACEEAGC